MYCAVNGIQMYYEVTGSGRPLVMVHGNGESHEIFDVAVRQLAAHYRVYTPDSRCHGRSTRTAELSYDRMASDLQAFLHAMGLEKPIFYGFSDGGILGLLLALREPELLGQLIISGANLNPHGLKFGTWLTTWLVALTGNPLYRMMAREPHLEPDALQAIAVPTAVLAGQRDVIRPAHTAAIASHIPGSILRILPGETHDSYIIHSEKLAPLLLELLALPDMQTSAV